MAAVLFALLASLTLGACRTAAVPTNTPIPATSTDLPALPPTVTPTAATPLALPTAEPTVPPIQPTPSAAWLTGEVRVFPGPRHYVGDLITVEAEVLNAGMLSDPPQATIAVDGNTLSAEPFIAWSPLRENALVFRWAWNTVSAPAGTHKVTISLNEDGEADRQSLEVLVNLEPSENRSPQEESARWTQRVNDCCRISYLTGTAAERDINELDVSIDQAFSEIEAELGILAQNKPVPVTLPDVIWGNGAYVGEDMVISYVDRAYTGLDTDTTIRHEAAHWVMRSAGTSQTPPMLSEGMAVYLAGGHFKPEPIPERASALLESDRYIPLSDLANDFWSVQHEVAYLESAGLVTYLVRTYGMDAFLDAYNAEDTSADTSAEWLDTAFRRAYNTGLTEIEQDYRSWLSGFVPGAQATDLELTIALYDTIREYETLYAQYEEALPSAQEAIAAAQVADFLREADSPYNIALETVFVSAQDALASGQYEQAQELIRAAQATLQDGNFTRQPISDYLSIAERTAEAGYEAQRITLEDDGTAATVEAIQTWPQLDTLILENDGEQWTITSLGRP